MYDENGIKKVQQRLLEMAKAIRKVFDDNDIPYIITVGTLLGAVRHKGFIPWDDDFDFHLFEDTYDVAIESLRESLPKTMFLEDAKSEPLYFHAWAHVKDLRSETKCDLFPQDGVYAHHGISIDLYKLTSIKAYELQTFRDKEHLKYLERKHVHGLIKEDEYNLKMNLLNKELNDLQKSQILSENSNLDTRDIYAGTHSCFYKDEMFPLAEYVFEDTVFKGPNNADAYLTRRYGDYMQLPPEDKRKPHYSDVIFLD